MNIRENLKNKAIRLSVEHNKAFYALKYTMKRLTRKERREVDLAALAIIIESYKHEEEE